MQSGITKPLNKKKNTTKHIKFKFCVALPAQFYIATLRAKRAEKFEIFLTLAPPPPPSEKWIDTYDH